jgi:pyruvate,orthophosphate dikinase
VTTRRRSTPRKRPVRRKPARSKRSSSVRRVWSFGDGTAEGRADQKSRLGGKGANLAEMARIGMPVPAGFTISTQVSDEFRGARGRFDPALRAEVMRALERVGKRMGARFGDAENPLLVSVRSGAPVSMPGMMDSILNLGLNDRCIGALIAAAGERFAWDSYRRLIQMYADVVLGLPQARFEARLEAARDARGVSLDTELSGEDLRDLVAEYLALVEEQSGRPFPQKPEEQLWGAIGAVFRSWNNPRAVKYRELNGVPESPGTAVNVQAMVYGNMGDDSATGVCFTRDPATGERVFFGEWLKNAQGEDVVAGIRTPQPINEASRAEDTRGLATLEMEMPKAYRALQRLSRRLEKHYREMQDIEFTIQNGRLWLLQTRTGKRSAAAAVRIAVDMAKERLIRRDEALCRVDAGSLDQLLHPTLDGSVPRDAIARGLPASPGAAVGAVVFSAEAAEARALVGEKVILVTAETSPDDIHGMNAAEGILTARGGMTSHAAVVARGMGKCCIAGCSALEIDAVRGVMKVGDHQIQAGDIITMDGTTGEVMLGSLPMVLPEFGAAFVELMKWADRARKLGVRSNADTAHDADMARKFGAEGIGLCRTEHMFFEPDRILAVRQLILAPDAAERERALAKLLPMQRSDFAQLFRAMDGLPVTVRLLDPPLHEFLPHTDGEMREVAEALGTDVASVRSRVEATREANPMLGHRGCRVGITFPEIYRMQVRAVAEAACEVAEAGSVVKPEIMIPLVAHPRELELLRELASEELARVFADRGRRIRVRIGTMIEVPRAALTADAIAEFADFFSFGTNDLTQMTYGLSRDDTAGFLPDYVASGILSDDPFVSIDEDGVGALVRIAVERGRSARPALKIGLCGEHGGDARSIEFCDRVGLDYVSCSPYRVPIARLAAAQAAIGRAVPRGTKAR